MKLFKFLITQADPILVDGIFHDHLLSFVLAADADGAKEELRKMLSLIYGDPTEYAWLDFVQPTEVDATDGPRVIGFAKFG